MLPTHINATGPPYPSEFSYSALYESSICAISEVTISPFSTIIVPAETTPIVGEMKSAVSAWTSSVVSLSNIRLGTMAS